jgi:TsgA-like MFS transporter
MAYLIFIFEGITAPLVSVLLLEIAGKFGVDSSAVGYCFTLWLIGGSITGLFSGKLIDSKGIRFAAFSSVLLIASSVLAIISPFILGFSLGMFISGGGTFLLVAVANCLIVESYDGEARTAQFNLLNFFYSFGALLTPTIAGFILAAAIRWEIIFALPFILLIPVSLMALAPTFHKKPLSYKGPQNIKKTKMDINVYFVSAAIGCYCASEMSFTSWFIVYLRESLSVDIVPASLALTAFFTCQGIGRLSSGFIVKHIALEKFIFSCCFVALLAMLAILSISSYNLMLVMTGALALGMASIYPSILSYGTQLKASSPQVVTFIMSGGLIGGVAGMLLTSFLKQFYGTYSCLTATAVSILLIMLFMALAKWKTKEAAS